jgi:hypothetical protein
MVYRRYATAIRERLGVIVVSAFLFIASVFLFIYSVPSPLSLLTVTVSLSESIALHPIRMGLGFASLTMVAYLSVYEVALVFWRRRVERLRTEIRVLSVEDRGRLLKRSRQGREQAMIGMGSLFIPTAFVLLAAAATASNISSSARIALAVSAPALYVLWLFLVQLTTRLMDDIDSQMRLYAHDGAATLLHHFYEDRHGFGVMMKLRRNHWLFYLPLITLGATMIIHSILVKAP